MRSLRREGILSLKEGGKGIYMASPHSKRLGADLLLLLTATGWGFAFIAQKSGTAGLSPLSFVGIRFAISALIMVPFVFGERRAVSKAAKAFKDILPEIGALSFFFFVGSYLQQKGISTTSVTNSGFLTALYVIFVPILGLIFFHQRHNIAVWIGGALAIAGTYFLNGASFTTFDIGDGLIILCAVCFAFQILLLGKVVQATERPFTVCFVQSAASAAAGIVLSAIFQKSSFDGLFDNLMPLVYVGVVSGAGFAMQAYAQQRTASADAAIIMSAESVFAAIGGVAILHERFGVMTFLGCVFILGAILVVELYEPASLWLRKRRD